MKRGSVLKKNIFLFVVIILIFFVVYKAVYLELVETSLSPTQAVFSENNPYLVIPELTDQPPLPPDYYIRGDAYVIDGGKAVPGVTRVPISATFTHVASGQRITVDDYAYDDGLHNDGAAGDGYFKGEIILDSKFPKGRYGITKSIGCFTAECGFYSGQTGRAVIIDNTVGANCKEFVPGTNNFDDKTRFNIVFIGAGVGKIVGNVFVPDWRTFFRLINKGIYFDQGAKISTSGEVYYTAGELNNAAALFNLPPFKDYKDKYNIWYIDPMRSSSFSGYTITEMQDYAYAECDMQAQYIVFDPAYSVAFGYTPLAIIGTNIGNLPGTTSHEIGHITGGLTDEYRYGVCSDTYKNPYNSPDGITINSNAYHASDTTNTKTACQQNAGWSYLVGTCYTNNQLYFSCPFATSSEYVSCFKGAIACYDSTSYLWRPASDTLMNLGDIPSTVDITAFCKRFYKLTGERRGICAELCPGGCAKGYSCRDTNNDGVGECIAQSGTCPNADGDLICDSLDNCLSQSNNDQSDFDRDGVGDACDSDKDGDGALSVDDCDDMNKNRFPGNPEICGNGRDENCDGIDGTSIECPAPCVDSDRDGYGDNCVLGNDCDDIIVDDPVGCPKGPESCTDKTSQCAICIHPGAEEMCDGVDNNCIAGNDEITRFCGSSIGACVPGTESCVGGEWSGICENQVAPQPESCPDGSNTCAVCKNGIDDNCDFLDDNCGCKISNAIWSSTSVSEGNSVRLEYLPSDDCHFAQSYRINVKLLGEEDKIHGEDDSLLPEFINNPLTYASWKPIFLLSCDNQGICKSPTYYFTVENQYDPFVSNVSNNLTLLSSCDSDGDLYVKKDCIPSIGNYRTDIFDCNEANALVNPGMSEICNNGIDDDCDGTPDNNCACVPGTIRQCGLTDIGACALGTQTCDSSGIWGVCQGAVNPIPEICKNNIDDNCDSVIDENCPICGNNIVEAGESCDGSNLDGKTCQTEGFDTGMLYCNPSGSINGCILNTSQCAKLPPPCTLKKAYWDKTNVVEGELVGLTLEGSNCDGETTDFKVFELDDYSLDDPALINPLSASFVGNLTKTVWRAEPQEDCEGLCGNPEYYFVGSLYSNSSLKIESGKNVIDLLKVSNSAPTKPLIYVSAPENIIYVNRYVPLKFDTSYAKNCWYKLDGVRKETSCQNDSLLKLIPSGFSQSYTLNIFANNSLGETNETRTFSVYKTRRFIVIYDEFFNKGQTTDLVSITDEELDNLFLILDSPSIGKISLLERVNLTKDANNNEIDIDSHVNVSFNRIEVLGISSLNKKARLELNGLSFSNPRILKSGSLCSDCMIESYSNGKIIFNVSGFSVYSAEETPAPPGQNNEDSGSGDSGGAVINNLPANNTAGQANTETAREQNIEEQNTEEAGTSEESAQNKTKLSSVVIVSFLIALIIIVAAIIIWRIIRLKRKE